MYVYIFLNIYTYMYVCVYIYIYLKITLGLPWWLSGKEHTCQCRRFRFDPWVRKIPWRRKGKPTPVFLPGKSHGERCLAGCSLWGHQKVGHDLVAEQNNKGNTPPNPTSYSKGHN